MGALSTAELQLNHVAELDVAPRSQSRSASGVKATEIETARAAFREVYPRLLQLPVARWVEPRGTTRSLLRETSRLLARLARPDVAERLEAVGVPVETQAELQLAVHALQYIETCVRNDSEVAASEPSLIEQAVETRSELLACCRWNLRASGKCEALARITDSDDPIELAMDLRELSSLMQANAEQFRHDYSADVSVLSEKALRLAGRVCQLPSLSECLRPDWRELRARAHGYLTSVAAHLSEAGAYAFRDTPQVTAWCFHTSHRGSARLRTQLRRVAPE